MLDEQFVAVGDALDGSVELARGDALGTFDEGPPANLLDPGQGEEILEAVQSAVASGVGTARENAGRRHVEGAQQLIKVPGGVGFRRAGRGG